MSLDFKLHYDRLREGDPTKPEASTATNEGGTFYEGPGHARNLCLIWPDGKQHFLNYAYLVSGEFSLDDNVNLITLNFSTRTVTFKGYGLSLLFTSLLEQLPKYIMQIDARYVSSSDTNIITEIAVHTIS